MSEFRLGIDIGGTSVKLGIVNEQGKIIKRSAFVTEVEQGYLAVVNGIEQTANMLLHELNLKPSDLINIGVGVPGSVDSKNGVVVYNNNLHWENVELSEALKKRFNKEVFIENDANTATLGEYLFGASRQYESSVLLTLGTGIGGGIIIEGNIFSGFMGAGGELGHMVIVVNGNQCTCGRKGCFEAYSSASALVLQTKSAMDSDKNSIMWSISGGKPDGATAFKASELGDFSARQVVDNYINYLAEGVINIVNIFRPQIVLIGGGVSGNGDSLLLPLSKKVKNECYGATKYAPLEIALAHLKNDAGIIGSAFNTNRR